MKGYLIGVAACRPWPEVRHSSQVRLSRRSTEALVLQN
jgi:hypothetical protein